MVNDVGWRCFSSRNGTPESVWPTVCSLDGFDATVHLIFVVSCLLLLGYSNFRETKPPLKANTRRHTGDDIRWLIGLAVIILAISATFEGLLTASTTRHLAYFHLYLPYFLSVLGVSLALRFSVKVLHKNEEPGSFLLLIYWITACCGQLLRILNLYTIHEANFATARLDLSALLLILYFILAFFEISVLCGYFSKEGDGDGECTENSKFDDKTLTLLSRLTYGWLKHVFTFYEHREVDDILDELGPMPIKFQTNHLQRTWTQTWMAEVREANRVNRSPSLWRVIVKNTGTRQLLAAFLKLVADLLSYGGPVAVSTIIHYVINASCKSDTCNEGNKETVPHFISITEFISNGYVMMFVLFITQLMAFTLLETHLFLTSSEGLKTQIGLQALIYQKILRLQTDDMEQRSWTIGKIINLASVDAKSIYVSFTWCEIWAAPLRVVITFAILVQAFGKSAVVALGLFLLVVPLQVACGIVISALQKRKKKFSDSRMLLTNELFQSIKVIKALAWEGLFCQKIEDFRRNEMRYLVKLILVLVFVLVVSTSIPLVIMVLLFGLFTKNIGFLLTPARAFFTIALLKQLHAPLTDFIVHLNLVVSAKVSIHRIFRFLQCPEILREDVVKSAEVKTDPLRPPPSEITPLMEEGRVREVREFFQTLSGEKLNEGDVLKIMNASFKWNNGKVVLRNIFVKIPKGGLTIVVGSVGSGKSSLLQAFLRELIMVEGLFLGRRRLTSVAYCAQQAVIMNATFRENILFGQTLDESRYKNVINACCLGRDVDILPSGDETEIGERGINLSGGQRQRLSLARALYSDKQVLLLDDLLSSLDVHVRKEVFEKATSLMRRERRTVVLALSNTNNINYKFSDHIVVMDKGTVKVEGAPQNLEETSVFWPPWQRKSNEVKHTEDKIELERLNLQTRIKKEFSKDSRRKLIEKEEKETGTINSEVYLFFIRSCTFKYVIIGMATISLWGLLHLAADLWLSAWSEVSLTHEDAQTEQTLRYYMNGYVILVAVTTFVSFVCALVIKLSVVKGGKKLHEMMINRVIYAPSRFFDVNPLGRILNRFSSDVNTADVKVDGAVSMVQYCTVSVLMAVIANIIVAPVFLFLAILLTLVFGITLKRFLSLSMKLQRASSVTHSPVLSLLTETIGASTTIRAYRDEERFFKSFLEKLDKNAAVSFYLVAVKRWLAIRLDYLGTGALLIAGLSAMIGSIHFGVNVSFVGLSLAYSLQISYFLSQWVRAVARLELSMNSVERIKSYCNVTTERYEGIHPGETWPNEGSVHFRHVHVRYAHHLDAVLKNITLHIMGNQKVGICGRTGSGKSTLALSLIRFVDIFKGCIEIDGIDIKSIPLKILRQRVAIIQQDAVLFNGTVRTNLDPNNEKTNDELWEVVKEVHLGNILSKQNGLETVVRKGGSNFSNGQRQLLCLARALVRDTKILIMDEATASDCLVNRVIEEQFQNKTILTIVHRIHTIINYDSVVVLDNGHIVEQGPPHVLLQNPGGIFTSMVKTQRRE